MLMVEHHMQLVMSVSDHIVVLASGSKLADGPPERSRAIPPSSRRILARV